MAITPSLNASIRPVVIRPPYRLRPSTPGARPVAHLAGDIPADGSLSGIRIARSPDPLSGNASCAFTGHGKTASAASHAERPVLLVLAERSGGSRSARNGGSCAPVGDQRWSQRVTRSSASWRRIAEYGRLPLLRPQRAGERRSATSGTAEARSCHSFGLQVPVQAPPVDPDWATGFLAQLTTPMPPAAGGPSGWAG